MKPSFLDCLCCATCRSPFALEIASAHGDQIDTGTLRCTRCGATHPIVGAIPRFVPADNYAASFGLQWNRFPKTQLDSHSHTTITRDRFLAQTGVKDDPRALAGRRVLDVGCGSGRFAEVALSLGAEVVALDYSSAIDACWANLGPGLHAMQASIYEMPLREGQFDLVYCFGVLMATPDGRSAFEKLQSCVKPGGQLVVDMYERSWTALLHPKYWIRPLTSRVPPRRLFPIVERAVPGLLQVSRAVSRVPVLGRYLSRLVPVANYEGVFPLDENQLVEWATLDTFDWLSPKYDRPKSKAEMREWMTSVGMTDVEVFRPHNCLLTARGRRPAVS